MKANMGTTDRVIRVVLALLITIFYFTDQISGTVAILLVLLALVFVVTSAISFCPLYFPFGISTKKKSKL